MNDLKQICELLANEYGNGKKWAIQKAEQFNNGWELVISELKNEGAKNESNK